MTNIYKHVHQGVCAHTCTGTRKITHTNTHAHLLHLCPPQRADLKVPFLQNFHRVAFQRQAHSRNWFRICTQRPSKSKAPQSIFSLFAWQQFRTRQESSHNSTHGLSKNVEEIRQTGNNSWVQNSPRPFGLESFWCVLDDLKLLPITMLGLQTWNCAPSKWKKGQVGSRWCIHQATRLIRIIDLQCDRNASMHTCHLNVCADNRQNIG